MQTLSNYSNCQVELNQVRYGVAAHNIGGMTVHSALLLGCNKFQGYKLLTADRLNTLRSISRVGSNMLVEIHKRFQEIKGAPLDQTFGGISILSVGDLYQLPPVCQPHLFELVSDPIQDFTKLDHCGKMNLSCENL